MSFRLVKRPLYLALLLVVLSNSVTGESGPPLTASGTPLFKFHIGFWLNLHHFLYVLGRARNGTSDSQRPAVKRAPEDLEGFTALDQQEQLSWKGAIDFYRKDFSKRDVIFDRELIAITRALASASDSSSLANSAVPISLRETLERVAPIYRRVWWPHHLRADKTRVEQLSSLLTRYGLQVSNALTRIYQRQWPADGLDVQVSAYANWGGAYSVAGGPIVMASLDDAGSGSEGLEIVFHEAMHQWDDDMIPLLNRTARRLNVKIPGDLFHTLIFYTAGYVVSNIVPGHHPYAESLWARGSLAGREQLDTYWLPYLKGNGTFLSAMDDLVGGFRVPKAEIPVHSPRPPKLSHFKADQRNPFVIRAESSLFVSETTLRMYGQTN